MYLVLVVPLYLYIYFFLVGGGFVLCFVPYNQSLHFSANLMYIVSSSLNFLLPLSTYIPSDVA